ncbi:MAG: SulP family inorganic anion transporter [Acidimicrobiales bacterium]
MKGLTTVPKPSSGDLVAGISVALVALPQSLAYAEIAGMPPQYGLFASALPPILAAVFVSSRYLQTGPVALTALLAFGALEPLATPESGQYIELAALLALLVGGFRVALGLLRMGGVAYLLSEPVLTGFTTGAAILILSSQLPKIFDVATDGDGVLVDAWQAITSPDEWQAGAIGFSLLTLVCMFGGRRLHKLFPGVLVAVIVGVVVSGVTDYSGTVVGELDGGFVSLTFDFPWDQVGDLVLPALVIALVGFAEPSSIARTFAAEEREPWDANREMVSQGVANLASAVSGAFPVGGSFSRSSLNRLAGANSAWAGAITGAFVMLALPLTPLLETLPGAILGAIVLGAVIKLVALGELVRLVQRNLLQAAVGVGTLVATLVSAPRVERGVLVGVALALGSHLYRELRVTTPSSRTGDVLTVAPEGVLWFATIPNIERLIRSEIAEHPDIVSVVLDLGGVGRMDYSAAAALRRLVEEIGTTDNAVSVQIINVRQGAARGAALHLED